MKRHWRRNSDNKKLQKTIYIVVGVLVVAFLAPRIVALAGSVVLYPVQSVQNWFNESSQSVPALWRDKVVLQDRIQELESELVKQAPESLSNQRLLEENHRLRSLLSADESERVVAAVVGRPDKLPFDVLQIDQGSNAGIEKGSPVFVNSEQVLGIVSLVYPNSALVTLFSTPGFSSTAYIGESDVLATVEGMGGGVARVLVPQGVSLRLNSLVYLPSIQPGVLGRIVRIENEPTQPQQFAYIVSDTSLFHLRYVSVGQITSIQTEEVDVEAYISEIQASLILPDIYVPTSTATTTDTATTTEVTAEIEEQLEL